MKIGPIEIEYPENVIAKFCCYRNPRFLTHRHSDTTEILYCLAGSLCVKSSEDDLVLRPGQCYIVNYGEYHSVFCEADMHNTGTESDEDTILLDVHLKLDEMDTPWEILRSYFFFIDPEDMRTHAYYEFRELLLALSFALFKNNQQTATYLAEKIAENLTMNFDWNEMDLEGMSDSSKAVFRDRLSRIRDYIYNNCENKIHLRDVAEAEHLNETYLSQIMKKTTPQGFVSLINSARCRLAERVMLETDMSLLEISNICGFSDPKYFYSAFTSQWGVKPGVHRKWHVNYNKKPEKLEIVCSDEVKELLEEALVVHLLEKYSPQS